MFQQHFQHDLLESKLLVLHKLRDDQAFKATGNKKYLEYALAVGKTFLSLQSDLEIGGWTNHAVIIPKEAGLGDETGEWTCVRVPEPKESGEMSFVSKDECYVTFDDSISTNGAMFLLELYAVIKDLNYSNTPINPLAGIDKQVFLNASMKFFDLVNSYRNFMLAESDFADIYIDKAPTPEKQGPHPFIDYLRDLPDHPLNSGLTFKPYANGGLPQGTWSKEAMLLYGGAKYGALSAGYMLHKTFNDHLMSRLVLYLTHLYDVSGDSTVLTNLNTQLSYLVKIFQENGNRAWCQQYHVLDDKPAPARPWESPSFNIMESDSAIRKYGMVEKILEEKYNMRNSDVRAMLEDAMYYIQHLPADDEAPQRTLFNFYALSDYSPTSHPSADVRIRTNDPIFSCDFYYPDDPYQTDCCCRGYQYFLIDESSGTEFVDPFPNYGFSNRTDSQTYLFAIQDECLDDASLSNYRGCLDLNKEFASKRNYWDVNRHYWGYWLNKEIDQYLSEYKPDQRGFWVTQYNLNNEERDVISTSLFRLNAIGIAKYLKENWANITDSDSDGISDEEEIQAGTDPHYPENQGVAGVDGSPSSEISGKSSPSSGCTLIIN
ncbi:MAG: pectate lyase [Pseudomonadota bacterium]